MAEHGYTYAQMRAMQQDAIRRVTEMHRAANEKVRGSQPKQKPEKERPPVPVHRPMPSGLPELLSGNASVPSAGSLEGIAGRLGLEGDQLLLLGLLLLLINEGADPSILLAVFYLLL